MRRALFPHLVVPPPKKKKGAKDYKKVYTEEGVLILSTPFSACQCLEYHCNNCYYYHPTTWKKHNND